MSITDYKVPDSLASTTETGNGEQKRIIVKNILTCEILWDLLYLNHQTVTSCRISFLTMFDILPTVVADFVSLFLKPQLHCVCLFPDTLERKIYGVIDTNKKLLLQTQMSGKFTGHYNM
jgi:hypothetical protein